MGEVLTANGSASAPDLFAVETAPTIRFTQRSEKNERGDQPADVGRVKPAEVLQPITSAPRMVRRCIESASTGNWRAKSPRPEQPCQPITAAQVGAVLTANGSASQPDLFAVETAPTIRFSQHGRRAGEICRGASANYLGAAHGAAMY